MKFSEKNEIKKVINDHNGFSESIIVDFKWKEFGTTIELTIRYVYDDSGRVPKSMDDWRVLGLQFNLVQELRVSNALTNAMCKKPEELNWGFNEIALMKLEDNPNLLAPYRQFSLPFHHVAILWENERRIDIVFSALEIPEK
jgi:hypothetical protein